MSTAQMKYILALDSSLAIHFATAADGSETVELSPIEDEKIIAFDSQNQADGFKDLLCRSAAALEASSQVSPEILTDYSLETLCQLETKRYTPEPAMA
jgi:hypothetical protein